VLSRRFYGKKWFKTRTHPITLKLGKLKVKIASARFLKAFFNNFILLK
jgi:hypothetical protein